MKKRILSFALALSMVVTMLPISVMAEGVNTEIDTNPTTITETETVPEVGDDTNSLDVEVMDSETPDVVTPEANESEAQGTNDASSVSDAPNAEAIHTTTAPVARSSEAITYGVWVGNTQVTSDNNDDVLGDGTGSVSYDPDEKKLYLKDADIQNFGSMNNLRYGIYAETDITISLSGTSTIGHNDFGVGIAVVGIYADKTLRIEGEGTLIIDDGSYNCVAIECIEGNLVIDQACISVTLRGEYGYSYGIVADNGGVILQNKANVIIDIQPKDVSNPYEVIGLYLADNNHEIMIKDGSNLKISTGPSKSGNKSKGFKGNLVMEDGTIEVSSHEIAFSDVLLEKFVNNENDFERTILVSEVLITDGIEPAPITAEQLENNASKYKYIKIESKAKSDGEETGAEELPPSEYGLWVGGVPVTKNNQYNIFGDGTATYYGDSRQMLVLKNAIIDGSSILGESSYGIKAENGLTIQLYGENKIVVDAETKSAFGIYSDFYIYTQGYGTLEIVVDNKNDQAKSTNGIYSENYIGISGGAPNIRVSATAGDCNGVKTAQVLLYNGSLTISAKNSENAIALNITTLSETDGYNITAGATKESAIPVGYEEFQNSLSEYKFVAFEPSVKQYPLFIEDVRVTSENQGDILEDGGSVSYDPNLNELHLKNAIIDDFAYYGGLMCGIYAPGEVTIVLSGTNVIAPENVRSGIHYMGIEAELGVKIQGSGKLNITANGDYSNAAISCSKGDVIIDQANIIAKVEGEAYNYGIVSHNGNLILQNKANVILNVQPEGRAESSSGIILYKYLTKLVVKEGSSLKIITGEADDGYDDSDDDSAGFIGYLVIEDGTFEVSSFDMAFANVWLDDLIETEDNFTRSIQVSKDVIIDDNYDYCVSVSAEELADDREAYKYIKIESKAKSGGGEETGGGNSGGNSGGGSSDHSDSTPSSSLAKPTVPVSGSVENQIIVSNDGTATVSITEKNIIDAIEYAKQNAQKQGLTAGEITVVLNVESSGITPSTFTVVLPKVAQEQIIKNNIAAIELAVDRPDVVVGFDQLAVKQMNQLANGDVSLTVKRTERTRLSPAAQNVIGNRPVYDFTASYQNGSKTFTNFGDGKVYVTIPYTLAANENPGNLYAVYVDANGVATRVMDSTYDKNSKSIIFATNHFSVYGVGYTAPTVNLSDIKAHWAKDSIDYMVARGLIAPSAQATFSPDAAITRATLAEALAKLAGIDTAQYATSSSTSPYIQWAVSKGIMKSVDDNQLLSISREELALVLQNFAKATGQKLPESRTATVFSDASAIKSANAGAVKAMQQAGIMLAEDYNKFNPTALVTRADASAILHRFIKTTITPSSAQGWDQTDSGAYVYYKNGQTLVGWHLIDGSVYLFNTDGTVRNGWIEYNGEMRYYYGNTKLTGFWEIGAGDAKKTYFFDAYGNMATGESVTVGDRVYILNKDSSVKTSV